MKDGQTHYVEARREVIVSGGAINRPKLLMLSGIGPRTHLEDMGVSIGSNKTFLEQNRAMIH